LREGLIVRGDGPSGELATVSSERTAERAEATCRGETDRGKLWRLTRPLNGLRGKRLTREKGTLTREGRSH